MAKSKGIGGTDMTRPGKGELGDLDHIIAHHDTQDLSHESAKGKTREERVKGPGAKDGDRKKRNKGKH